MNKEEAGEIAATARLDKNLTWAALAEAIDRSPAWTVAAILGRHPIPAEHAATLGRILDLDSEVVKAFERQPYRTVNPLEQSDPTIYRFYEALQVYGPALKELIHEEFGDGIMSAINFNLQVERRTDPSGDRVVVTFDGKFLNYQW